ncbi:MAG: translation initiation factor [Candidatus Altiarchaeota archaeon]
MQEMNCPRCGLPEELCVCEEMTKEGQNIKVRSVKRRYGKFVTIVEGFQGVDIHKIAKELKQHLACGGTSKDNSIELQGDHKNKVKGVLIKTGFPEDAIKVL